MVFIYIILFSFFQNDSIITKNLADAELVYSSKNHTWLKDVENIEYVNDSTFVTYSNQNSNIYIVHLDPETGEFQDYKQVIKGRGKKKGKLLDISSLVVSNDLIYISDRQKRVINIYNLSGQFFSEVSISSNKGEIRLEKNINGIYVMYENYENNKFIHELSLANGWGKSFYDISKSEIEYNYHKNSGRLLRIKDRLYYFALFSNIVKIYETENYNEIYRTKIYNNRDTILSFSENERDYEGKLQIYNTKISANDIFISNEKYKIYNGVNYNSGVEYNEVVCFDIYRDSLKKNNNLFKIIFIKNDLLSIKKNIYTNKFHLILLISKVIKKDNKRINDNTRELYIFKM